MDKVLASFDEAVADIFDGASIMIGCCHRPRGVPRNLLLALQRKGTKNLTVITPVGSRGAIDLSTGSRKLPVRGLAGTFAEYPYANNWIDHDILLAGGQVRKIICSIAFAAGGRPNILRQKYEAGEVEMEHTGHGPLAARIWAGGAGVTGFYTAVGVGTILEEGKEKRTINGQECLLEMPLTADFSLIWAYKADKMGNLVYRGTSRQWGPLMARAAKVTIAEVYHIVEPGELDPEVVVTPGIYVHRIVQTPEEDRI